MPRVSKMQLPLAQWPEEDQRRWDEAFRSGDIFDEDNWPAPGFEDTELGVFMEPEVSHGETKVYAGVQA